MASRVGVVVFVDLVGYSQNQTPVMEYLGNAFMQAVGHTVRALYPGVVPERTDTCPYLILPTGDGAAVILWDTAQGHPRLEFTALVLGGMLLRWAQEQQPAVGLRCGINAGQLEIVTDPYGAFNVCGTPINDAQRIMDAAHGGQMLVHAEQFAARLYTADEQRLPGFHYRLDPQRHDILAKHGRIVPVQSITGTLRGQGPDHAFGLAEPPAAKWHLQITPTQTEYNEYGIAVKRPFADMLLPRQRLAFVGATHDQLPEVFRQAIATSSDKSWRRLLFFFLEDESLRWIRSNDRSHAELKVAKRQTREALEQVLRERVAEPVEFREYQCPFFFGAFFDWEAPGGRIHVSPYIWGINVRECPGLDYEWRTPQPTEPYLYYRRGLEELRREEWSQKYLL
jgi:hypothetical protein